jgi:ribonuclease P protein component
MFKLCSPKDFQALRHAKRITADGIRVYSKRNEYARPRLGMVIAKREIPKAVTRNRIKRMIREAIRLNQYEIGGFDIVIVITKQILQLDNKSFHTCLNKLLKQLTTYYVKQSPC